MINKGIIRNITNKGIFVQPFSSEPTDNNSSCSSGSCKSCSKYSKKRLIQVLNPEKLTLETGNLVEFEIPSAQVVRAFFKLIIFPIVLFTIFYFVTRYYIVTVQSIAIAAGLAGFIAATLLNYLLRKKSLETEKPIIIKGS